MTRQIHSEHNKEEKDVKEPFPFAFLKDEDAFERNFFKWTTIDHLVHFLWLSPCVLVIFLIHKWVNRQNI